VERKRKKDKMAITRKQFVEAKFTKKNVKGENHPALKFLEKNDQKAFTVDDIAKATKKAKNTIHHALRSFVKKGKVLHKSPYYMIK